MSDIIKKIFKILLIQLDKGMELIVLGIWVGMGLYLGVNAMITFHLFVHNF